MNKEDMLKKLADCVCDMEDEEIVDAVQEYLAAGYDPQEGLLNGLVEGMRLWSYYVNGCGYLY